MSYLSQFGKDYDAIRAGYPDHWQIPDILDARFESIGDCARNVTSQFGEDGLLEAIFEIIGVKFKTCFEVGASDDVFFSNTKALRDKGWSAVLVESDVEDYRKMLARNQGRGVTAVVMRNAKLSEVEGLDFHMSPLPIGDGYDLGVIDTDGDDIGHWRRMVKIRPRVLVIECAERENAFSRQAKVEDLITLGKEKKCTAVVRTYCNLIFIADEEIPCS